MAAKNYTILETMIEEMAKAPTIVQPSKLWEDLNEKHLQVLDLDTFKTTVALHYFTFFCSRSDPQVQFLQAQLPKKLQIKNRIKRVFSRAATNFSQKFPAFSKKLSCNYIYLTLLLWDYIACTLPKELLEIEEPNVGSPLLVKWKNKLVTEDLGNSLIEFHTITSAIKEQTPDFKIRSILELGAGYGRLGYVFLKHLPKVKYIVADIPPALFVAQSYLSQVFEKKKIFPFRSFDKYSEIEQEFEQADICFLLPHQLALLPDRSIDLAVNISSLHEMKLDQVRYYFSQFERLVSGYFYFKQWKESYIPQEKLTIKEADYPIPGDWEEIFWRTSPVQTLFFEALFQA